MILLRASLCVGLAVWAQGAAADGDVYQVCTFETLPPVVMHYPEAGAPTMSVDNRAPAALRVGQGSDRIASATIDGYSFQFHARSSNLAIMRNGDPVASEIGRCARVGGPVNTDAFAWQAGEPDAPVPVAPAPAQTQTGAWEVDVTTSRFDDTTTVVLALSSNDTVPARFGSSRVTPRLILRCLENTTSMYIVIRDSHLADIQGYGTVDYRIDDRPAGEWRMNASTDNEALGLWRGNRAIPQIRQMFGGDRLDVRLTPFSETALTFRFPIAHLEEAVVPLRESCSW